MEQPSTRSESTTPRGRGLFFVSITAAGVAAAAVLATIDPNEPGHYPTCPFLAATGLWCPGCGSMRATHDLLHGDVASALQRNPLAVLAAPVLIFAWINALRGLLGKPTRSFTNLPPWTLWALLALIGVYWVARNIPGWTWLSPA